MKHETTITTDAFPDEAQAMLDAVKAAGFTGLDLTFSYRPFQEESKPWSYEALFPGTRFHQLGNSYIRRLDKGARNPEDYMIQKNEYPEMSEVLYEANPSMIRMYPFGTVFAIVLIPVGIGILLLLYWYLLTKSDKLTIKTDEIVWTHGLISKQYTEINMASVRTTRITQSLFQRILGAGNVAIYTAGDEPEVVVKGLPNPEKIRDYIKGQSI